MLKYLVEDSAEGKSWPDKSIRNGQGDTICTAGEKSVPEMVTERPCRKASPWKGQKLFLAFAVTDSQQYSVQAQTV